MNGLERKVALLTQGVVLLAISFRTSAGAAVWKVDSNVHREAHFRTLQEAADSEQVQPGDILYVAPSPFSYGSLTLSKRVIIIGPGYFLNENQNYPQHMATAGVGAVAIVSNANGSVVSGLQIGLIDLKGCSSITIKRNLIGNYPAISQDSTAIKSTEGPLSSILILQNIIYGYVAFTADGAVIRNNYMRTYYAFYQVGVAVTMENNVIQQIGGLSSSRLNGATFRYNVCLGLNNILIGASSIVEHNVINRNSALFDSGGGTNPATNNIFADPSFAGGDSPDGHYRLSEGSPGSGAGPGGTDCGMFGGSTPYVLSGLPSLPTVVAIDAPLSVSDASGLPVTVRVQVNP